MGIATVPDSAINSVTKVTRLKIINITKLNIMKIFLNKSLFSDPVEWAKASVGNTILYISLNIVSILAGIILMRLYLNIGAWLIICITTIILPMEYLWVIRSLLRELKKGNGKQNGVRSNNLSE